tara:strand:+ start:276 stop:452 length:177 start_codon:yes stop_codon:yes gene_type:complete
MFFLICNFGPRYGPEVIDSFKDKKTALLMSFEYRIAFNKPIEILTENELKERGINYEK